MRIFSLAIAVTFVSLGLFPAQALGGTDPKNINPKIPAVKNEQGDVIKDRIQPAHRFLAYCYEYDRDARTIKYIDCDIQIALKKPETPTATNPSPGHKNHADGRPIGKLWMAEDGVEVDTLDFTFYGNGGRKQFFYLSPEAAGEVIVEATTIIKDENGDARECAAPAGCTYNIPFHVRYRDLKPLLPLEGEGIYHKVVRNGVDKHPNGTYAKTGTINKLEKIANDYYGITNNKLSINDMSLPWGGMFDLNGQWWVDKTKGNGHVSHRTGTSIDINSKDAGNWDVDTNFLEKLAIAAGCERWTSSGIHIECK